MALKQTNPNFLNGIPELLVLEILSQEELYGYELVKKIKASSQGIFSFEEGCIYPVLHALEKKGYLKSRKMPINGRERLYYQTTTQGLKRLEEISSEWQRVVSGVGLFLKRKVSYERA